MLNRLFFFRQYASRLACAGIVVTCIAGCGGGSSIASPSTATSPSAPTSLVATAGNASASFSFSAPGNIGGANVASPIHQLKVANKVSIFFKAMTMPWYVNNLMA